jgi:multicomponent Na+:H+ antiporter subunit E
MRFLALFLLSMLFWLLITFSLDPIQLLAGAAVSLLTAALFSRYYVRSVGKFLEPARWYWLVVYLFVFTWECIKANFEVAYRVLHPALPIRPGIVKVKMGVKSDLARTFLANSITMTPGTLSVDIIGDYLFVHWIYVKSTDPQVYSEDIAGRFERYIKKIFE